MLPVRCSRCARVRFGGYGSPWQDHPSKLKGEVGGFCATCGELLKRLAGQRYVREGRGLLRQRERGFGPALEGVDVFQNFRDVAVIEPETEREKPMPVPANLDTNDVKEESKHIRAADFPMGWKAELEVTDVNVEQFERDGKKKNKFLLSFKGKEKTFVLNQTNQTFIEAALGTKPAAWVGAKVRLSVVKVKYQNQMVPGFVVVGAVPGPGVVAQAQTDSSDVPF